MLSKTANTEELKGAIRVAFDGDESIYKLYDPNAEVKNVDEITNDICKKLKEFEHATFKIIVRDKNVIGYFVYHAGILISFALNIKYRTKKLLKEFLDIIKVHLSRPAICILWDRNIRAIKFLVKGGFVVKAYNEGTTILLLKT